MKWTHDHKPIILQLKKKEKECSNISKVSTKIERVEVKNFKIKQKKEAYKKEIRSTIVQKEEGDLNKI